MPLHRSLTAGILLAAASAVAGAQGAEAPAIGFDAGVTFASSPSLTTISFPFQNVRVTIPMANGMAWEPSAALNYMSANGNSFTTYALGLSLVDYVSGDATAQRRVYVRPFLGAAGVSAGGGGNSTASGMGGVGVGMETRVDSRLAIRWEGSYRHVFDVGGANMITGSVGLTFRLR